LKFIEVFLKDIPEGVFNIFFPDPKKTS